MSNNEDTFLLSLGSILSAWLIIAVTVGLKEMAGGLDKVWNGSYVARSAMLLGPVSVFFILLALVLMLRWSEHPIIVKRVLLVVNTLGFVASCLSIHWGYRYISENGLSLGAMW